MGSTLPLVGLFRAWIPSLPSREELEHIMGSQERKSSSLIQERYQMTSWMQKNELLDAIASRLMSSHHFSPFAVDTKMTTLLHIGAFMVLAARSLKELVFSTTISRVH